MLEDDIQRGDVAKRQEYSNWRKLGFMDENNECSKDHRGDGSLWFWDSQEQLSRERHFWEEASETTTDTKSLILKIIPLHLMNPRQAKRLDNQDVYSSMLNFREIPLVSPDTFAFHSVWRVVEVRLKPWLSCAHNIVTGGAGFTEWQMSPHGPCPHHSPFTPLNMRGECIPFRPPSLDLK